MGSPSDDVPHVCVDVIGNNGVRVKLGEYEFTDDEWQAAAASVDRQFRMRVTTGCDKDGVLTCIIKPRIGDRRHNKTLNRLKDHVPTLIREGVLKFRKNSKAAAQRAAQLNTNDTEVAATPTRRHDRRNQQPPRHRRRTEYIPLTS